MKTTKPTKKAHTALTTNSGAPAVEGAQLQTLTANLKTKLVRNETLEGKSYLVAPMVMLVEGVHAGSNGPLYYPKDELAKTPAVWNHKPVVVTHPTMNGQQVSACDPAVLEKYKVGLIMNTKFDKMGRLIAEAWIDPDKADAVDPRIKLALNQGTPMELSTGLFTDNVAQAGEYEGEKYTHVATNYRPDHLALLPDAKGACSMDKGAGFIRNEAEKKGVRVSEALAANALKKAQELLALNELSFADIREKLRALLNSTDPNAETPTYKWIVDVYADFFVYELSGKLFKQGYAVSATDVSLSGDAVEVTLIRTYSPVAVPTGNAATQNQTQPTHNAMKEQLIAALIANHGWTEADRPTLNNMTEDQLKKLVPAKPPVANTVEDFLKGAPAPIAEVIQNALASEKAQKDAVVANILAFPKNTFTKEQLDAMPVANLKAIAALGEAAPAKPNEPAPVGNAEQKPAPNYGGQAPAAAPVNNAEQGPALLGVPSTLDAK